MPAPAVLRQRWQLAGVISAVVVVDQVVKWWAWRHIDGVLINSGGYILLGPGIRSWFAGPIGGAIADVIGATLVMTAVLWLSHRRRPAGVLLGGGLISAGWLSNILDRLGLHNWTAPGSARGVVDFIPDGTPGRSNLADAGIALGVLLLVASLVRSRLHGPSFRPPPADAISVRSRAAAVLVLLAAITLAVAGALDRTGIHEPGPR